MIGIQESTLTVVVDKEIIDYLIKDNGYNTIEQLGEVARSIAELAGYKYGDWQLGAETEELSDYLSSFITNKGSHATVKVGGH